MATTGRREMDDCLGCVYLQRDGTCGCRRSVMSGVVTNMREQQVCHDRRGYSREAFRRYRRKRKIVSIYDYE